MTPFKFYLGTHKPAWLATSPVPLFVSRRTLAGRASLPVAATGWALDSGGFSELSMYGEWRTTPAQYVEEVRRYRDGIGRLDWAAAQDWMCEPVILAKTGLTVEEHQRRTIENFLELRALAPDIPFAPVLQGWAPPWDYLRHAEAYAKAGVDLASEPIVGLGSVCRRQHTGKVETLIRMLASDGIRVHGFGFKKLGLRTAAPFLASADSLAWSLEARRHPPLPGCSHASCNNCYAYAKEWRDDLVGSLN